MKNDHGLLIHDSGETVGYLMVFSGHGIYAPTGKIDVTPEVAKTHNDLLSQAELLGLDNNCKVGQEGIFYYVDRQIKTWTGTVVSTDVAVDGTSITFKRNGKIFRGQLKNDMDCFTFKRIC
jgi:hypothetical protein